MVLQFAERGAMLGNRDVSISDSRRTLGCQFAPDVLRLHGEELAETRACRRKDLHSKTVAQPSESRKNVPTRTPFEP